MRKMCLNVAAILLAFGLGSVSPTAASTHQTQAANDTGATEYSSQVRRRTVVRAGPRGVTVRRTTVVRRPVGMARRTTVVRRGVVVGRPAAVRRTTVVRRPGTVRRTTVIRR